ncbi:hypothetical protein [Parvicella tangerina]|uniref:Tol-Pal system protein TolB n=1 Tax=Parvicella tangerina TaxID=2829795 RepID=A0A916JK28_9FLAO|nr:hypothetical protein [Parvicella tangerina]CAG5077024.1 Tol-Pal system protein TolB [Parvicella tangerina]
MQRIKHIVLSVVLLMMLSNSFGQFYTGSNIEFGQNRVQYHSFFWQYYHFENFKVYFSAGGENHAVFAAKAAEKYLLELSEIMDYDIDEELEFIIFNSQSQFKESNIGLSSSETNIGGTTRIEGEKVFLYYEGTHDQLERQVRSGIAKIIAFKMMYGSSWREALKNSSLLALPKWYIEGFVAYMEGPWNTTLDNTLRADIKTNLFDNLNHLEGEKARLAGHSIWNYISEVYGDKMIPNILYMTRLSKNVESGFLYVLGSGLSSLSRDVKAYYNSRYDMDAQNRSQPNEELLPFKIKKKYKYYNLALSPDGNKLAFATNELGQYKVWIYDIQEDKLKKIAKGDHKLDRLPDYSYPVMSWHPTGRVLTYIAEKKGNLTMNIYDVDAKKNSPRIVPKLDKILSISYNSDGKQLAMSAVKDGKTDIYVYNIIGNNQTQLTDDIFDDLDPSFVDGDTKIIFASNRFDDTIRKNVPVESYDAHTDLFVIDVKRPKNPLQRITSTPLINEIQPAQYDGDHYTYLSDENGIYNRYIAYYDSAISYIDTSVHYRYFSVADQLTNYPISALDYELASKSDEYVILMRSGGSYQFLKGMKANDLAFEEGPYLTKFMETKLRTSNTPLDNEDFEEQEINNDPNAVDIDNYQFDTDLKTGTEKIVISPEVDTTSSIISFEDEQLVKDSIPFELPRRDLYVLNFANDFVVSQFDNGFLNQTYQRLSPSGYINPGFNGIFKLGLKDVFEDYKIIGGFRYPVNFSNTEYLLSFENLKNRLDKKYLVSRRAFRDNVGDYVYKIQNYEIKALFRYPFSEVASLRLTTNARYDINTPLSVDRGALEEEGYNDIYGGLKLEYVYDITRTVGTNIRFGTRFKAWGEYMQQINTREGDFFTFGLDFRHYQKIHRTLVFASRVAVSTSVGSQRLVYFMGGVDNWMGAKFDNSIQISPNENYQFQTIATPLRGFHQNARNGNTFAVINNELRFPVFKYLAKNPIRSDFIRNFMIIGFADVGSAWTGKNPYDLENSFNTTVVEGKNYEVILDNQKEPIIYGYGGGLRSKVLGYYVRFDLAWGVDDGVVLKPVTYFSLALDF